MLPKMKKYIHKNKKQVRVVIVILLIIIVLLVLFKSLFYSSSEKSTYGVRLRDIKENEFTKDDKKKLQDGASGLASVKETSIEVKGRLIKVFVTFEDGASTDDIKNRFNDMLGYMSEQIKGYYDVTFYAEQTKDGKTKYPVIGYKHKNNAGITFDVL